MSSSEKQRRIRVLVVDDSQTVRAHLVEVLRAHGEFEVVGEASDGKAATELCAALQPDVVTLDMMLPTMSGLAATEHIMAYSPTPILIVSSSTNRGEVFCTYDALTAGAVDVLEKPGATGEDDWERRFVNAVKMVARIKVITHLRGRLVSAAPVVSAPAPAAAGLRVVAIGASTGGPAALLRLLGDLPRGFPIPIIIVIHLGALFAAAFAEWLADRTKLHVEYAVDGQALPRVGAARVLLAPPDRHLVLRGERLSLSSAPERHSCRPSVDALFESLAHELGPQVLACVLTGMGKDGAAGLLAIRRAQGMTIAQDEATSVVFGMPREAILLDAADRVLPIEEIGASIARAAGSPATWRRR